MDDLDSLRSEMYNHVWEAKDDLRSDIAAAVNDLRSEMADAVNDLRSEIAAVEQRSKDRDTKALRLLIQALDALRSLAHGDAAMVYVKIMDQLRKEVEKGPIPSTRSATPRSLTPRSSASSTSQEAGPSSRSVKTR